MRLLGSARAGPEAKQSRSPEPPRAPRPEPPLVRWTGPRTAAETAGASPEPTRRAWTGGWPVCCLGDGGGKSRASAGSVDRVVPDPAARASSRTRPRLCQSRPARAGPDLSGRPPPARLCGPPIGPRAARARRIPKPDRPAVRPPATCAGSTSRRRRRALSGPPRRTRRGTCGPASLCGPTPSAFGPRSTASPKSRFRYPSA